MITEKAAAKVNLNLQITGKRADGYHLLSSLFVFTDFGDVLSFRESDEFKLKITGEFSPLLNVSQNLQKNSITQAAKALAELTGVACRAEITLEKNIPVAAGIGGGTADAAAALKGLMKLWNVSLNTDKLQNFLPSLGADVPACYAGKSVMVGGIGEILTAAPTLPKNIPVLLVNPRKKVPTKNIFTLCDSNKSYSKPFVFRTKYNDVRTLAEDLHNTKNDLLPAAESFCPDISLILRFLKEQDSIYSGMSGSGATCFALFADNEALQKAAEQARKNFPEWWIKETFII